MPDSFNCQGLHAQNLIPRQFTEHPLVQKAAKSNEAFHIDNAANGIPLPSGNHLTGHSAYNDKINDILTNLHQSNQSISFDEAFGHFQGLNDQIKSLIIDSPNYNMGQIADLIQYP